MVVSIAARLVARKLAKKLAQKAAQKKAAKIWRQTARGKAAIKRAMVKTNLQYKGVHKDVPRRVIGKNRFKFKQKPKHRGGGAHRHPQISAIHPGAQEIPVNPKVLSVATRRGSFKGARHLDETWLDQNARLYGGIHMSQEPSKIKKSIKILTKKKHLRKKALGGFIIGKNVDCSLL